MRNFSYFLFFQLAFFACNAQKKVTDSAYAVMLNNLLEHNVPELSIQETVVKSNEVVVFIDTREYKEYKVSHLKNAIWLGYKNPDYSKMVNIDKKTTIIVYCSIGYRSEKITSQLLNKGYKNIYNLYGGLFEWVNQGNPVYDGKGRTSNVHAYDANWGVWLKRGDKVY